MNAREFFLQEAKKEIEELEDIAMPEDKEIRVSEIYELMGDKPIYKKSEVRSILIKAFKLGYARLK